VNDDIRNYGVTNQEIRALWDACCDGKDEPDIYQFATSIQDIVMARMHNRYKSGTGEVNPFTAGLDSYKEILKRIKKETGEK
jgi:hypothetical protein